MNIRRLVVVWIILGFYVSTAVARAETPPFDDEESSALQTLIQNAVMRALNDPSVGDGDPLTHPPATVIWSHEAPALTEAQRVALAQMVDGAVRKVLAGNVLAAGTESLAASPARPARSPVDVDDGLPMTDLRADTLRERVAIEQGFDVEAARLALSEGPGSVGSALALTNVGLNSAANTPRVSSVQIIASNEGARASLKLDQSSSDGDAKGSGEYWSRSMVFSAPVDKNDKVGTGLIGLDGLTNNFEFTYNVSRIRTKPLGKWQDGQPSLLFAMPEACRSLDIPINECEHSTLLRVAHANSGSTNQRLAIKAKDIIDRFAVPGYAWVQGLRLKAGYDDFTFFDPTTLQKRSQDEVPWGVGLFGGVLAGTSYYTVGIDYQRGYKAAASGTACPVPAEGATVTRCVSGALGEPSSNERQLLNFEGRWLIGESAIGAKLVHDFKNDFWGIDVPVYLFPNDKGLLSGGLRFGWTNTEQFSAGIFVGVPFKLLD